jgi:uncharacterized phage protein gp47/JayE
MPAPFGLTVTGLSLMSLSEIRDDINARVWATLSSTLDLSDRSIEGQIIGTIAERFALLWELVESVNSSMDPDKAVDASLDALCLLTGTFREGPIASSVTLTLTGTAGAVVSSGSGARIPSGARFDTAATVTLVAVAAWAGSTSYAIGARRSNSGKTYQCTVAGVSAASGGPTSTAVSIADGSVTWRHVGSGTAAADVAATATVTGPTIANSGTITEIATPIGGWTSVINLLDADVGSNLEQNESLRIRRNIELAEPGTGPADAVRSALLKTPGVTAATVFFNNTDAVNVDGVPGHSVEALVTNGLDQEIFATLFANVAAGIGMFGVVNGTVVDSQGTSQAVGFSRPTLLNIYASLTVIKDPLIYPADGDLQIEVAIVKWGDLQATGKNVVAAALIAQAFLVLGVLDVTACFIGLAPSPASSATIAVSLRQIAVYDTSRITVTSSDGVP